MPLKTNFMWVLRILSTQKIPKSPSTILDSTYCSYFGKIKTLLSFLVILGKNPVWRRLQLFKNQKGAFHINYVGFVLTSLHSASSHLPTWPWSNGPRAKKTTAIVCPDTIKLYFFVFSVGLWKLVPIFENAINIVRTLANICVFSPRFFNISFIYIISVTSRGIVV